MTFFKCNECSQLFSRKQYFDRHLKEYHQGESVKHYTQKHDHIDVVENLPRLTKNDITRIVVKSAFQGAVITIRFIPIEGVFMPREFFRASGNIITETLEIIKQDSGDAKVSFSICVQFKKVSDENKTDEAYFSTKARTISTLFLSMTFSDLMDKIENFSRRGSSWVINKTCFVQMNSVCNAINNAHRQKKINKIK